LISAQQPVLTDWHVQLPHAEEQCKKCGTKDAVYFQSQQRTAETGMVSRCRARLHGDVCLQVPQALFYVCCNCQNVWSTLDAQK